MGMLIFSRLAAPFGMWETHAVEPFQDTPDIMVDLRDQWQECASSPKIPRALDFTPVALRSVAHNLALVDLRLGVEQARYLWAGQGLVKLFGAPLTGKLLSQCYSGPTLAEVRDAYRRMVELGGPVFSDRRFRVFTEKLGYHRLILPLLDDTGEIGFAMLMILPKGNLHSASDWRYLEMELDLVEVLRGTER